MTEKIEWSGKTSSFHHKHNTTPNPPGVPAGLRKVWFMDVQWSTCPIEVYDEVRELWNMWELGNDNYIIKTSIEELVELGEEEEATSTRAIRQYIAEHDIPSNETVIIHWWW